MTICLGLPVCKERDRANKHSAAYLDALGPMPFLSLLILVGTLALRPQVPLVVKGEAKGMNTMQCIWIL